MVIEPLKSGDKLRILVACEYSGRVRDALIANGHDAISCDLLPTDAPGPHYQGDVFDIINDGWDGMVGHPPCTYLANSGVRWLYEQNGRWELMQEAAEFFKKLLNADIPRIAIENPTMHGFAKHIIQEEWSQSIQPYEFGHPQTKSTKLWLKNLPELNQTNNVKHLMRQMSTRETDAIHYASPGPDRWKERSTTFQGIADAIGSQWFKV